MNENLLQKVVFLDRDGVINRDSPDYVKSWTEFHFLPRSKTALKNLVQNGFVIIVITNQSAINRKMISKEELEFIHRQMRNEIMDFGGEIKDIFCCPHLPEDGCECRKPKPGLIYQAHREYRIDIPTSVMVGDNAKDIECARNAGCGSTILVRTGNGEEAEKILADKKIFPDHVAEDLYEAVNWIIAHCR